MLRRQGRKALMKEDASLISKRRPPTRSRSSEAKPHVEEQNFKTETQNPNCRMILPRSAIQTISEIDGLEKKSSAQF
ncbi:hypothetical protein AYI69_g3203 [Smittium culicis]|uniref:Uncharacterized protein n=1 Tax=Smittium culicis TaxID=133412 RepID=A0A1R1YKD1_9FUNG|nr:hypothetical protein AYI69_g3203 [Smittium culicis]